MKVLSIDLDYFMSPTIELYNSLLYDRNPSVRWKKLFDNTHFKENHLIIDQSNLLFCFDVFLKALKNCDNVSFGYEHDAILYGVKNFSSIDLINIDHHDDVLGGDYANEINYHDALSKEYDEVVKFEKVHEGNWISWLASHNKINSCVWIGSENSLSKDKNYFNEKIIPNYTNVEKEEYKFENYDFDFIFVCLSPQYVPKNHWHYFKMFISTYEHFKQKDAIIINRKHEHEIRYSKLNNEILY